MFVKFPQIGLICIDSVPMATLGEVLFPMWSMVLCKCVFFFKNVSFFWPRFGNTSLHPQAKSPCICIVNHQLSDQGSFWLVLFLFCWRQTFFSPPSVPALDTITFFHSGGNSVGMNLAFSNIICCAFSASTTLSGRFCKLIFSQFLSRSLPLIPVDQVLFLYI